MRMQSYHFFPVNLFSLCCFTVKLTYFYKINAPMTCRQAL